MLVEANLLHHRFQHELLSPGRKLTHATEVACLGMENSTELKTPALFRGTSRGCFSPFYRSGVKHMPKQHNLLTWLYLPKIEVRPSPWRPRRACCLSLGTTTCLWLCGAPADCWAVNEISSVTMRKCRRGCQPVTIDLRAFMGGLLSFGGLTNASLRKRRILADLKDARGRAYCGYLRFVAAVSGDEKCPILHAR
jgi:hypothetical protein